MNTREMTPNTIRTLGIQALAKALGPVGMMKFLQQFDTGSGDYTKERHEWLDKIERDTFLKTIRAKREEKQEQANTLSKEDAEKSIVQ